MRGDSFGVFIANVSALLSCLVVGSFGKINPKGNLLILNYGKNDASKYEIEK